MNFDVAIKHVLAEEGGFTKNRKDPGNWTGGKVNVGKLKGTKFGISAAAYPDLDIENLTREQAVAIYRRDYWDKFNMMSIPAFIRLHYFDVTVNSGNSRAVKIMQRALGLKVDGILGNITRSAIPRLTITRYAQERSAFYINHVKLNPDKMVFLEGWENRVITVTIISLMGKIV